MAPARRQLKPTERRNQRATRRSLEIGGFHVIDTTAEALARLLRMRMRSRIPTAVFFANANMIVRCTALADATSRDPGVLLVNDGIAMAAAAKLHRFRFRENLNGTDFTPLLLRRLPQARLFLFGGRPEVVAQAATAFQAYPNVDVVGVRDGYSALSDEEIVDEINRQAPDVLLVALGNPLQEKWILANRARLAPPVVLAVGALFDFTAGAVSRAPAPIRRLRLEWAYRLYQEPRRLLKRYTIDTARFFYLALPKRRARA